MTRRGGPSRLSAEGAVRGSGYSPSTSGSGLHRQRVLFLACHRLPLVANPRTPTQRSSLGLSGDWVYEETERHRHLYGLFADHSLAGAPRADLQESYRVIWVGTIPRYVDKRDRFDVRRTLIEKYNCLPVFMEQDVYDDFYNGFCKEMLWPALHYVCDATLNFQASHWNAYHAANALFADAIKEVVRSGDLVWVHDYHLMLLPSLVRRSSRKHLERIGFFLHTPFPSSELFRMIPVREDLLTGILGCDLVGFQTYGDLRHFTSTCTRIMGTETSPRGISLGAADENRFVSLGAYPVGPCPDVFEAILKKESTRAKIEKYAKQFEGMTVLLGIDSFDFIKGIPIKLQALDLFLSRNEHLQGGKVVLLQVTHPSSAQTGRYEALDNEINELVGRINSRYGHVHSTPVHYLNQVLPLDDICALYCVADALLITSIREGMNMCPHEFIICRSLVQIKGGSVILSELSGASHSFHGAHLVNPWNIKEIAEAIEDVVGSVTGSGKDVGDKKSAAFVREHTAQVWRRNFIADLIKAHKAGLAQRLFATLTERNVTTVYKAAKRRLIIVDYDQCLCPAETGAVEPSSYLHTSLSMLASDLSNTVVLLSDKDPATLTKWFGETRLILSGARGEYVRWLGETEFEANNADSEDSAEWMDVVAPLMHYYSVRTPGSWLEHEDHCVTWHHSSNIAATPFSSVMVQQLLANLISIQSKLPVTLVQGPMSLELRSEFVDHAGCIKRLLAAGLSSPTATPPSSSSIDPEARAAAVLEQTERDDASVGLEAESPYDFVLAVGGDDRTLEIFGDFDSNMAFLCTVDKKAPLAHYNFETPEKVVRILHALGTSGVDVDDSRLLLSSVAIPRNPSSSSMLDMYFQSESSPPSKPSSHGRSSIIRDS